MSWVPHKIVGEVYARSENENGESSGEVKVAELVIFASEFGQLKTLLEEKWPELTKDLQPRDASEAE